MTSERARVLTLLDELQAAERAGAAALGDWVASCRDPALRGGLRVMRARDTVHAALAEARLRALGGEPSAQAGRNLQSLCGVLAAPEVSDRSKVTILLSRFPDGVYDPFAEVAAQLDEDDETRALLATIGDDERTSLRWLRETGDPVPCPGPGEGERALVAGFLDALVSAEAAGADVLSAWIAACGVPGLRGGLRTLAARERTHAALLAERLREVGAAPATALAESVRAAALARFGARGVPDDEKLAAIIIRYPTADAAAVRIELVAESLDADPETRTMLYLVAAAESATIAWLRAYHSALAGGTRAHAGTR